MTLREQLQTILDGMPADIPPDPAAVVQTEGAAEPKPAVDTEPSTNTIEPSTLENTTISAPPIKNDDITVVTSEDIVGESIDMRLASFYTTQQELSDAVKILTQEVKTLKAHFEDVEKSIDAAAATSPTVSTIETLINQL